MQCQSSVDYEIVCATGPIGRLNRAMLHRLGQGTQPKTHRNSFFTCACEVDPPARPCWYRKMAAGTDSRKSRKSESQVEEEEENEMEVEPEFSDPDDYVDDITDDGNLLCGLTFMSLCVSAYVANFPDRLDWLRLVPDLAGNTQFGFMSTKSNLNKIFLFTLVSPHCTLLFYWVVTE